MPGVFQLVGADGSPYSCKVRAVLRYRRIPFRWVRSLGLGSRFPKLKAKVIPVLVRPDGSYTNDSTPILKELDATFPQRRICPSNAALNFVADVLEDFADEWMTKVMFEGRFHTDDDARFGAAWQARQIATFADAPTRNQAIGAFAARQVGRRELVGSTDWDVMRQSLDAVCQALEDNVDRGYSFLLGHAPTQADFGLYGQLRQCINDPRTAAVVRQYPGAWGWVLRLDDLSGYELPADARPVHVMTIGAQALLDFAQRTYFPFLLSNEEAFGKGRGSRVRVAILDGSRVHEQPAFRYQVKCLHTLQHSFCTLGDDDRVAVATLMPLASLGLDRPSSKL